MASEEYELVDEALKKIGRNILIFQSIEKGLKLVLPFIHPNASANGIESFRRYKQEIQSKTLGYLINAFIESVNGEVDLVYGNLKKLVAERNKLAHNFCESAGLNIFTTKEGCKNCITDLDLQCQEARNFLKEIRLQVFCMLAFLRENYADSVPNIEILYQQSKAEIISYVEYINLSEPSETSWENTRIVNLPRLAELNTDKVGDMTLLARAGQFIKSIAPDRTPKDYGIKTLKGVLMVSGLFEIIETQDNKDNSTSVLYKSKVLR